MPFCDGRVHVLKWGGVDGHDAEPRLSMSAWQEAGRDQCKCASWKDANRVQTEFTHLRFSIFLYHIGKLKDVQPESSNVMSRENGERSVR